MKHVLILVLALALSAAACGDSSAASTTSPGGDQLIRGPVFITSVDVLLMESFPVQVALDVAGDLPSPCHRAEFEVEPPDADGTIVVDLYSLYAVGDDCPALLEPFRISVPVGSYTEGSYVVMLDGERYPFTI